MAPTEIPHSVLNKLIIADTQIDVSDALKRCKWSVKGSHRLSTQIMGVTLPWHTSRQAHQAAGFLDRSGIRRCMDSMLARSSAADPQPDSRAMLKRWQWFAEFQPFNSSLISPSPQQSAAETGG